MATTTSAQQPNLFRDLWLRPDLAPRDRSRETPTTVSLAWLLAKKPWIVPISRTIRLHRLEENLGSRDVALYAVDLRELEDASARIEIDGARYPEIHERLTGR